MACKAIVGLGNPGTRYAATRHNVGFMVVERLAPRLGMSRPRVEGHAAWAFARVGEQSLVVARPLLYMNRSGEAVAPLLAAHGVAPGDLLVVHDDLDLEFGRLKLKRDGGTAGHRGLESLVAELATAGFSRLRVGIGRPAPGDDPIDWVLSPFAAAEVERLPALLDAATAAAQSWLELAIEDAMNRVNARPRAATAPEGDDGGGAANGTA